MRAHEYLYKNHTTEYRKLGKTWLEVSHLSFGVSSLGSVFHATREEESIEAVFAAIEGAFTRRLVCIGYAKQDAKLPTRLFVQKELDIRGSRNAMPNDFRAVISYLERGSCPTNER